MLESLSLQCIGGFPISEKFFKNTPTLKIFPLHEGPLHKGHNSLPTLLDKPTMHGAVFDEDAAVCVRVRVRACACACACV